jgi:Undecaprenyl-phosphate glucose phosphotransferase
MRKDENHFLAERESDSDTGWNGDHNIAPQSEAASLHAQPAVDARKRTSTGRPYYTWQYLLNALRLCDFAALFVSGSIANVLRFGEWVPNAANLMFLYFASIATLVALQLAGCYRPKILTNLGDQLSALFVGGIGAAMTILIGGFVTGSMAEYSRAWIIGSVAIGTVILIGNRIMISIVATKIVQEGHLRERIVLVGVNDHAEKIIANMTSKKFPDMNLLGIFDDRSTRISHSLGGYPIIGTVDELLAFVRCNKADRVVVTLPWTSSQRIQWLLKKLRTVPVRIDLVPHDMIWQFQLNDMERVADIPVITIANRRIDEQSGIVKRAEDVVLSLMLLILTAPVMLLIAIAIKLDGPGPVLFRQKRHGFNNEVFEVFKFRSMRPSNDSDGNVKQATRSDSRVTTVGRFLRRSSLDELPQLLNVLMGTMSVVGPRPHAVTHNIQYAALMAEYFARHNVKPGITGWAQVNGLRGETDTEEKMRKRVEYDLHYIEHWSLLFDLKIVLMTAITVWVHENAY